MVFDPVDVAEVTTAERIRSRVDRFMFGNLRQMRRVK